MKAIWNDTVIAESDDTIEVEGDYYFPAESLNMQYIQSGDRTSYCPWKGTARYYTIEVDGESNRNAAWSYAEPRDYASHIRGYMAFWKDIEIVE